MVNYIGHSKDFPTKVGGNIICRGTDNFSVPVAYLLQMEATAIFVNIVARPRKLLAVSVTTAIPGRCRPVGMYLQKKIGPFE